MRKSNILLVFIGFCIGVIGLMTARFIAYKSDNVHYHANFALYVDGTIDKFNGPGYYEEVQACTSENADNPRIRTHLHDENPSLVHVHAHTVTWGQFFTNLGYSVGDSVIQTGNGVFADDHNDNKLTFWLNGKKVDSIAGRVIKSEDVLLINYGKDDDITLQKRYDAVPRDAREANTKYDPAGCSGDENLTFWNRLKRSSWFE